jgi:clan AA aspartic protease (TIGR02281 family)
MFRACAAAFCFACLSVALAAPGEFSVSYDDGKLSVVLEDVELTAALDAVNRETGVRFEVGAGVAGRLNKRFADQPLDKAIARLLSGYSHVLLFAKGIDPPQVTRVLLLPEGSQDTVFAPPEPDPPMDQLEPGPILEEEDPGTDDGDPRMNLLAPSGKQVTLRRHRSGHFVERGRINGSPVQFLVDTGATTMALPEPLAISLRLPRGQERTVHTAAGTTRGYQATLERVEIGPLVLRDVQAIVLPAMESGGYVLLGMSFLSKFDLLQRQDTLVIRETQ